MLPELGLLALIIAGDRLVLFNKSRNEARAFATKMGALLAKGDLDGAAGANLGKDIGDLGRVITSGLTAYRTSAKIASKDLVF